MKKLILICFCLLVACGPKQMKFEQSKWNKSFDGFYDYRENMVNDLIENHLQKGMSYKNSLATS